MDIKGRFLAGFRPVGAGATHALAPTAYAVGYILAPLRGLKSLANDFV